MTKQSQRIDGKATIPALDFEPFHITTNGQFFLGTTSGGATLHVATFNQPGTTWAVDIWAITGPPTGVGAPTTSVGVAFISPAVQGTFGYNVFGRNGFLVNSKSGTPGDLTISYRTTKDGVA